MKKSMGEDVFFDGSYTISIELSWDQYKKQHSAGLIGGLIEKNEVSVDCDASAFIIEEKNGTCEVGSCACYEELSIADGAVVHGGDNIRSDALGNDEVINVDLGRLPANVKAVVFTLDMLKENKKHLALGKLDYAKVRIKNTKTGDVVDDYNVVGVGDKAIQTGVLERTDDGFVFKAQVMELKNVSTREELAMSLVI